MDFHSLPRRELQVLCKKNKIPANVTNVAMADSLNSLEIVEGIDEVFQTCESEMAQLSIEPRVRLEVASPFLPPTGGRSTRSKNAATEGASRHSTRTTMAKYANESQVDAFETPVAPQTNRKKGQTASACIKMDSLFKECAQDAVLTPAPWGVTSQRRRAAKEDSAVKQVQGTRRSARLAEKSAKMLKGENSNFSKKDLFTEDSQELNPDVLDEISGVTDVSASTNMEECSAKNEEEQVDSAEKQDIATDVEIAVDAVTVVEENHEKKIQPEIVPCDKQVVSTAKKDEEQVHSAEEQDIATGAETVVDAVTIVVENPENKIQSECEKQVVSTVEEVELVSSNEGEMSDSELTGSIGVNIEQVAFGSKISAELDNQSCAEASEDANIVMALNLNNEAQEAYGCGVLGVESTDEDPDPEYAEAVVECEAAINKDSIEMESNPDESDSVISKYQLLEFDQSAKRVSPETFLEDEKIVGQVFLGASTYLTEASLSEEAPTQQLADVGDGVLSAKAPKCVAPSFVENEAVHQLPIKLASSLIIPPASTQKRASASKETLIKKRITAAASDNKENIKSGSKTTRIKERSEVVKEITETVLKLDDQTVRHLSNEVKKLEITQKLDKNEGGNEVSARPALLVLQKNQ